MRLTNQIGVWSWQRHYDDLDVLDGTQWGLDLNDGVNNVQCSGSNAYPGGNDLEHARPFQEFLAAMSALIRGRSATKQSTPGGNRWSHDPAGVCFLAPVHQTILTTWRPCYCEVPLMRCSGKLIDQSDRTSDGVYPCAIKAMNPELAGDYALSS
jgi:hypothetical protein